MCNRPQKAEPVEAALSLPDAAHLQGYTSQQSRGEASDSADSQAAEGSNGATRLKKPNDMLQWIMDERVKRAAHDWDFEKLSDVQLELANAAIHTTSMALLNMLFDLVAMPDYQDIIRQELEDALAQSGGRWNGSFLKGLQKTDSFMKEIQRHQPVGLGEYYRCILGKRLSKNRTI